MAGAAFLAMCCCGVIIGSTVILYSVSDDGIVLDNTTKNKQHILKNMNTFQKVGLNSWDNEEEQLIIDRAMARVPTEDELIQMEYEKKNDN